MKRFTLLILCVCAYTSLFSASDTIRILGIGNSFTMDAMEQHLEPIMASMDQPAILAYPYRGGTTLQEHDMWKERTDTMPYNYCEWCDGELTKGGDRSANYLSSVTKEPWDYIIFQTDHAIAGKRASYEPYLTNLINYAKQKCSNKNVKIGLYMTWAYDSVSTYTGFRHYGYDTNVMYDSIINCVKWVMANHKDIDILIPVGTAIQNGRTSYKGHTMNRDGYHLNYNHGRYICSLCWGKAICGFDPKQVPYYPGTISEYCANMCRQAVENAFISSYDTISLRAEYGKSESESQPADESRLQRVTFNGLSVPIVEGQYVYTVKINTALTGKVTMYSYPISSKAEQNITNTAGADIPRDPQKYGYFPLDAPALGKTVTYTNKVIAEDLKHATTYTFYLVGAEEKDLVYTIGSRDDLQDFANAVNGGQYGLNAELVKDVVLDMDKQECWRTPIGTIAHPYTGTFDGKGYTLQGFNIYNKNDVEFWAMTSLGLFGAIKGATIKNLTLTTMDECYFMKPGTGDPATNLTCCGILTGYMAHSTISNCKFDCDAYTTMKCPCGIICGKEDGAYGRSVIDRCEVKGVWRARQTNYYAGCAGQANNLCISNTSSHVRMPLETDHGAHIAGFVGLAQSSETGRMVTLQNCYFAGYINDDREAKGATTVNTPYLAAFISYVKEANSYMDNCYYLKNSSPKVVAVYSNHTEALSATTFPTTSLTDSTLVPKLGGAFVQGENYPVIGQAEPGLVEKFSKYDDNSWKGSADPMAVKNGDLCDWEVFHARRRIADRDYLASGEYATWFANTADGYIKTNTAWEGGVKTISFRYNKYEANVEDIQLTISVGTAQDVLNALQVPGTTRSNFDYEYTHAFEVKENAVIQLAGTGNKVIHVGNIAITPYLRYLTKQVEVDAEVYASVDYQYTNLNLMDNTNGEGAITYALDGENVETIASVDATTGEVTMLGNGTVTVQALWEDVVTSYQLTIKNKVLPTVLTPTCSSDAINKILQNNRLLIKSGNRTYDLLGREQ